MKSMKSIIRVEKHTSQYSIIHNSGLNDRRLSLKSRGLLGYILTKPDDWEITVSGIVSQVPDGPESVQTALKELARHGYAELRTVRGENGRLGGKKWFVFETSILDNQTVKPSLSSHRQGGFPIIGKTESRENRVSGNPVQVSTDTLVNTDYQVNPDLRVRGGKKNGISVDEKNLEGIPPSCARPPRPVAVLFSESGWPQRSSAEWFAALQSVVPGCTIDQSNYYFIRCQDWSAKKGSKASSWIDVAAKFLQDDSTRSQNQKTSTNDTIDRTSNLPSLELIRSAQRAARFARRNGLELPSAD